MDITIDTSALIAVITNEIQKHKIIDSTLGANLYSPLSVHWEIGNAFSAMIKRDRITIAQALTCLKAYQEIPIKFIEVDFKQTLEIVGQLKIYAYDAYLIQCARQTKTPLLTLDRGLISAAKTIGIKLVEL
ncbi:MAG: type II toxin-antitoxin system VapC family toxin [Methylococcales bacterium]|nr:type II toxin-antitoxin system VapC family toxin [Methylococcales bacterium]